jgi:hypothetical protein
MGHCGGRVENIGELQWITQLVTTSINNKIPRKNHVNNLRRVVACGV